MMRIERVITRRPSAAMVECELTHMSRAPIDIALAEQQHAAYRQALGRCSLAVDDLPALEAHADAAFVEDIVVALPELFVMTRPGAASRRDEVDVLATSLPLDRPVERLVAPATLDGGDVLKVGRHLFVGRSTRTNDAGIAGLAAMTAPYGYTVSAIDMAAALHLKTAVTALADDLLLLNPAWVSPDRFGSLQYVEIASDEPFAGNCLKTADRIFMQVSHARTAGKIERAGFAVELIDISEFAKAEAGLTCLSVLVPPAIG